MSAAGPRPVTVKGVCVRDDGRVLLCRNHRDEWELPGGRPEHGETLEQALRRELREETALRVQVGAALGVWPLEVLPGRWVDVAAFVCRLPASDAPGEADARAPVASDEHSRIAWLDPGTVCDAELPAVYRQLIARASARPRRA